MDVMSVCRYVGVSTQSLRELEESYFLFKLIHNRARAFSYLMIDLGYVYICMLLFSRFMNTYIIIYLLHLNVRNFVCYNSVIVKTIEYFMYYVYRVYISV